MSIKIVLAIYILTNVMTISGFLINKKFNSNWEVLRNVSNVGLALVIISESLTYSLALTGLSILSLVLFLGFIQKSNLAMTKKQVV